MTNTMTLEYWGEKRTRQVGQDGTGKPGVIQEGYGLFHCPCGSVTVNIHLTGWIGCGGCGWGVEMDEIGTIIISHAPKQKVAA